MSDEAMRRALLAKLNDPQWKAEQDRRYRQIVGGSLPTEASPRAARRREYVAPDMPVQGMPLPPEEEAATIDALWMGNWQRSVGALTITRFPDDTIVLDLPGGERTLFQPCPAPRNRLSFRSETRSGAGRTVDTYRCPERYETAEEALLEMHRAALDMFAALAAENEA